MIHIRTCSCPFGECTHALRERLKLSSAPTYSCAHLCTLTNECYSLETLPLCTIDLHKQPAVTFSCTSTLSCFYSLLLLFISFRFTSFHPFCSLAKCHKLNDRFSLWPPCNVQCSMCARSEVVHAVRCDMCGICKMVCVHCMNGKISHPKGKLTGNEPCVDDIVIGSIVKGIYYLMCASMRTRCKTKPLIPARVNFVFPRNAMFSRLVSPPPHPIKVYMLIICAVNPIILHTK